MAVTLNCVKPGKVFVDLIECTKIHHLLVCFYQAAAAAGKTRYLIIYVGLPVLNISVMESTFAASTWRLSLSCRIISPHIMRSA